MSRKTAAMPEKSETAITLEAEGLWVELTPEHTVLIPLGPAAGRDKQAVLGRLQERPRALAALLEHGAGAIAALLPEQPPWQAAGADGAGGSAADSAGGRGYGAAGGG